MQVLCDFDGTITMQDVTNLIWDHYIGPSWREDLLSSYKDGQISHLKIMVDGYKLIRAPKQELLDFVKPQVKFRPGFDVLLAHCRAQQWPMTVVSGGLDFYIEHFLPPEIRFYSYKAALKECWEVTMPPDIQKVEGEDFKVQVKKKLKALHGRDKVIFIGDGRNDFPVASMADRVFAVRGSTLARMCREQNIMFEEFDDFAELTRAL